MPAQKTSKTKVQEIAGRQRRRAGNVVNAMRAHGWKTHYAGAHVDEKGGAHPVFADSDDAYRTEQAAAAVYWAIIVARDADAVRSHVEAWARQQGVDVAAVYAQVRAGQ